MFFFFKTIICLFALRLLTPDRSELSHKFFMRMCERESVFETDPELLKLARVRIGSTSAVQGLKEGARGILEDYVTKERTGGNALHSPCSTTRYLGGEA